VLQAYDELMKGFSERNKVYTLYNGKTFDIFELLIVIYFLQSFITREV
jgi:hypothetical protein